MTRDKLARYQYQSWLVRRWRDRYLLRVPWVALQIWWAWLGHKTEAGVWRDGSFVAAWDIALGLCDVDRQWLFDWEDLRELLQ